MSDAAARVGPFTARTAPAVLEDLGARLRATRWPDAPEDGGWALGTDVAYLRELVGCRCLRPPRRTARSPRRP